MTYYYASVWRIPLIRHGPFLGVLIAVALIIPSPSEGASRFWTGIVNGNFSTASNWLGNVAPTNGDDLVFQANMTQLLVTNNFSPNRPFNTVLFQGSNYFVRGNSIILSNGISSINSVGANHIDADVELRGSQAWEAQGPLASLDINGDINLNANTLTVRANTGDFFFSGVITGIGNIVKTNVGTLRMDGAGHNTYTGFTRLDGGVLDLDKFAIIPALTNFTAVPGDLVIGDGNGLVGTDVLRLLADDQIADTSDVTVKNTSIFDLNGNSDRIGSLTMQGGTIETGGGVLILGGNLTTLSDSNTALIEGHLSLGGASRTFNVNSGPPGADLRINAVISGDAVNVFTSPGFTKTGGGSLFLTGVNTYDGTTTINEGQLALLADRALGTTTTFLGAPAGTIVNNTGNLFLNGVRVTNENLTINSPLSGGAFNASGPSIWTGSILLNTNAFISSSGSLLLMGEISGAGGFTKLSSGSVTLAGTNRNTYTGATTVRDGTLLLDKDTTAVLDGAMSGPLVIGEDELPENTDIVRYLACCQLPDNIDVTINASGLLDLNGFGDNVNDITFNGGDLATGSGSILPTGDITVNRNLNSQAIVSGRMSVLSNPIINVTGHNFSPDLSITAQLHGAGGFTKNGVGQVGLNGANIYTGQSTVNDGLLMVNNSSALGSTANGTVVNSGAGLALNLGVAVGVEPLSLAGPGYLTMGALSSSSGSNSWAGNITLMSNATIYVDAGDFLNLSGAINASGASDTSKTGTGTLIFSGGTANSFDDLLINAGIVVMDKTIANATGPANISIGDGSGTDILRLRNGNQIVDTTELNISTSGRFELNGQSETTGAISGRGLIDLSNGVLRAGTDGDSSTFSGPIIGMGSLFKLGAGTWTLSGNNTYAGQTTVSAGTLVVDGSQPQSPVTVNGTATLMGTGVVGDLHVFGTLRPGSSPGMLTTSNVLFAAQGHYFVELNGSTAGTGYDQLNVRGTNQLGGSTLHVSVGAGFTPVEGERLVIINNDASDAISGTFTGMPNGSILTAGGLQFRIVYSDVVGNDVALIVTNTALTFGGEAIVETGNGNGEIEPGECNQLRIMLTNKLAGIVSGVSATLSSTDPAVIVTQPFSTYPNLPANGRRTNNTPFQISTSPGLVCGANIDLQLTVHTATNGSFSVPIRMFTGAAGAPQRFNRIGDQPIPDLGTLDSTIAVSGITRPVHHVVISLHLTHATDDNLDISIEDPGGTSVLLSSDNGGTSDDYGTSCADADRTTFSDSALSLISLVSAPFRGTFRPEQPLSVYRGKFGSDVNGTWHLSIADDTAGGLGTLRCWSIMIFPSACQPGGGQCEDCPGCPVHLDITDDPSTQNRVLLKWSTAFPGFELLANPTLTQTSSYLPIGPAPVVVGSKFTVTNITGGTRFYILRKP